MNDVKLSNEQWRIILACLTACGQANLATFISTQTRQPIVASTTLVFQRRAHGLHEALTGE